MDNKVDWALSIINHREEKEKENKKKGGVRVSFGQKTRPPCRRQLEVYSFIFLVLSYLTNIYLITTSNYSLLSTPSVYSDTAPIVPLPIV